MNPKFILLLFILFFSLSLSLFGQNGALDLNFNHYDTSLYHNGLGVNDQVDVILRQPDGKLIAAGEFLKFNGKSVNNLIRLMPDGTPDPLFQVNQIYPSMNIKSIALQADGKIILGGEFYSPTQERSGIKRLNTDGTIDHTFFDGSLWATVYDLEILPDGKIIAAGFFETWEDQSARNIVRLEANGHRDNTFAPTFETQRINDIELFSDGSILTVSMSCHKLQSNGALDPNFYQGITIPLGFLYGEILPNNSIILAGESEVLLLNSNGFSGTFSNFVNPEPDGKIRMLKALSNGDVMIGWVYYNTLTDGKMYRFSSNLTIDQSFECTLMGGEMINSLIEIESGKMVIGGSFGTVNGIRKFYIAEMESSGKLTANNLTVGISGTAVYAVAIQPDHKILSGGNFSHYRTIQTPYLARTDQHGNLDLDFVSALGSGPDSIVREIMLDPAGKILVSGDFSMFNEVSSPGIARLNSDGSIDPTFVPFTQINGSVFSMAFQADGKILIAGDFTAINDSPHFYIARLLANGTLDPTFVPDLSAGATAGKRALKIGELSSGKILVAGNFACCASVMKLNTDGTPDNTFAASIPDLLSADFLEIENDAIIIGGTWENQTSNKHLLKKLTVNGDSDSSFVFNVPQEYDNELHCIKRVSENKFFIGGKFIPINSYNDRLVAFMINENGTVDSTFNTPMAWHYWNYYMFDISINDAELQSDGKIVVVGEFQLLGDVMRHNIARLDNYTYVYDTICGNDIYTFGSQNIDASGRYVSTFQSSMASDSVVVLNLEKMVFDAGIVADSVSLTANCTNCDYQWINCTTNELISGANAQVFFPSTGGNYAVILSNGICTDTSDCIAFNTPIFNETTLYPNPSSGEVNIGFTEIQSSIDVIVSNNVGVIVFQSTYSNTSQINLSLAVTAGFYQVKLVLPTEEITLAVVIE